MAEQPEAAPTALPPVPLEPAQQRTITNALNDMKLICSDTLTKLLPALAKAQARFTPSKLNAKNPHFNSEYAALDSVIDSSRLPLAENELVVLQPPFSFGQDIAIVTILAHSSGEWIKSVVPIGKPGTPQQFGSAVTYYRRYCYAATVCSAPEGGEDDDGNAASNKTNNNARGAQSSGDRRPPAQQQQQGQRPPTTGPKPDPRQANAAKPPAQQPRTAAPSSKPAFAPAPKPAPPAPEPTPEEQAFLDMPMPTFEDELPPEAYMDTPDEVPQEDVTAQELVDQADARALNRAMQEDQSKAGTRAALTALDKAKAAGIVRPASQPTPAAAPPPTASPDGVRPTLADLAKAKGLQPQQLNAIIKKFTSKNGPQFLTKAEFDFVHNYLEKTAVAQIKTDMAAAPAGR